MIIIFIAGVTFDLSIYWHQYPWTLGEIVCKLRAWIAEMWATSNSNDIWYSSYHILHCMQSKTQKYLLRWDSANINNQHPSIHWLILFLGLSTARYWQSSVSPVRDIWPSVTLSICTPWLGRDEPRGFYLLNFIELQSCGRKDNSLQW